MKIAIVFALILVLATVANALTSAQIQQVVSAHSAERALVGLGPVTYNASIGQIAQNYVDGCPSGHSGAANLGENMYWGYSEDLTDAVNLWASEKQYWNCETNRCCKNGDCSWYPCGHYTQIVWASSTQIGCGIKLCKNTYTVVCNYYKPGNYNCEPFCDRPFPQANCPVVPKAPTASPTAPQTASPAATPGTGASQTPGTSLSSSANHLFSGIACTTLALLALM
eukprot:TRINITY_DN837_c0_g1_i1.p1 TRINITY_DN837_c0_g1~~TRINITY_DN837_c0_g1_i1.p1  ORF type:complete len:225 (-),score=31.39 TRINITY_DN837_c0_g1_i1:39-713(-)